MPRFGCRLQKVVSYWVKLQGAAYEVGGGGGGAEAPLHNVNGYQDDMQWRTYLISKFWTKLDWHNDVIWRHYDVILLNLLAEPKFPSK